MTTLSPNTTVALTAIDIDRAGAADLSDDDFGHILRRGVAIGMPATYALSLLLALPGAGWSLAPIIALWPALVAGPWVGGTMMLVRRSWRLEHHATPAMPSATTSSASSAPTPLRPVTPPRVLTPAA